jgi:hypothetical protein
MIERIIWSIVVVTLLVLLIINKQELNQMSVWVDEQNEQLQKLDSLIDDVLISGSSESIVQRSNEIGSITDFEIQQLKKLGLENPVFDLKNDLMQKSELIQFDGVLGGTMRIISPGSISLLHGGWAYAVFEDGHINGGMLLEHSVQQGVIEWKILQTKLF